MSWTSSSFTQRTTSIILLMDKSLHDLVQNYAKIARKSARHKRRAKLAAALRAAANFRRRGCRVFPLKLWLIVSQIVQRFVHPQFHANFTLGCKMCHEKIACVHSGALRAPLSMHGEDMAHFAGRREVGVKSPMTGASVDTKTHTTHAPDCIFLDRENWGFIR